MQVKLDIYDILATFLPGILVICFLSFFFPASITLTSTANFPEAFAFLVLVSIAFVVGSIIQALARLAEGMLDRTWGGKASDRLLSGKDKKYFPSELSLAITNRLQEEGRTGSNSPPLSNRALFQTAIMICQQAGGGRTNRFNALYGYDRDLFIAMIVGVLMFVGSWVGGDAVNLLPMAGKCAGLIGFLALCALLWNRTRQRGIYYAREVLRTAYQLLLKSKEAK